MNENLVGLFEYTLPYHVSFFMLLFACNLFYLLLTQLAYKTKNYTLYIRYYLPFYHTILACLIFTGIILLSSFNFKFNHSSGIMLIVSILLIASSAIGYKRLKIYAKAGRIDKFRAFSAVKGILDIVLVLIIWGI